MPKFVKILMLFSMLICVSSSYAKVSNYIGLDYNVRIMEGRDRYNYATSDVFPKTYHGFELYAAHRFDNDVGLSLSWEQTAYSDNSHVFSNGEHFIAIDQVAGNVARIQSRVEVIHFDVNGYFNVTDNFEVMGQMGLGLTRVTMHAYLTASGVTTNMMPSNNFDNLVPRVGLGLQYFSPWHIGIRASCNWQGMVVYNMSFLDEDGLRTKIKPFDQSWIFAIGIVGRF
jgi:hypothetical protein